MVFCCPCYLLSSMCISLNYLSCALWLVLSERNVRRHSWRVFFQARCQNNLAVVEHTVPLPDPPRPTQRPTPIQHSNKWGSSMGSRGLERHGQLIGQSIEGGGSLEVVAGKCISSDVCEYVSMWDYDVLRAVVIYIPSIRTKWERIKYNVLSTSKPKEIRKGTRLEYKFNFKATKRNPETSLMFWSKLVVCAPVDMLIADVDWKTRKERAEGDDF